MRFHWCFYGVSRGRVGFIHCPLRHHAALCSNLFKWCSRHVTRQVYARQLANYHGELDIKKERNAKKSQEKQKNAEYASK